MTGLGGGTGTIDFDGNASGATVPGMTSALTLTLVSALAGTYTFDYSLANSSTTPVTAARVTAFAFDTDPNIVSGSAVIVSGDVFDTIRLNSNLPNGVGGVELCFTVGNCTGGGSGGDGVQIGDDTSKVFPWTTMLFGRFLGASCSWFRAAGPPP